MSASISFPALTSDTILFENKAAAVAFFSAFNVPSATTTTEGVVKQVAYINYVVTPITDNTSIHIEQDGASLGDVPTLTAYNVLKGKFQTLEASYKMLLNNLYSAGILAGPS